MKSLPADADGANDQDAAAAYVLPLYQFQDGLGDHPLWPALLDEIESSRRADVAEANRLADLEMADRAQLKLFV